MKKQLFQRCKASFLLAVFLFDFARPYVLRASTPSHVMMIDGPVAASGADYVDLFTGDFKYGVPLMVVPGPNGEAISVTANYHGGGIRMEESASWIGLGWDYNPGEISRSIVGTFDDNKGHSQAKLTSTTGQITAGLSKREHFNYGPIYYSDNYSNSTYLNSIAYLTSANFPNFLSTNVTQTKSNDFFRESIKLPGYDKYHISGPGIAGTMKPFHQQSFPEWESNLLNVSTSLSADLHANTSHPEFLFENSSNLTNNDYNSTTRRFPAGYYIRYFTNAEINNSSNLYSSTNTDGFLDYRIPPTSTRRPSSASSSPYETAFDTDGIGGFKVTDPSGISYHYSLPVYTLEEYFYTFEASYNGTTYTLPGKVDLKKNPSKYATSWKLTAVTGPDYEDTDNNKMVNEGDKGYWVSYNYSLWCDNFLSASSQYGFGRDMVINKFSDGPIAGFVYTGNASPRYSPMLNVSKSKRQVYYLNSIKTSTHTAFFLKELRSDEISYDKIQDANSTPIPLLKLSKIILLRNEDAGLLANSGTLPSISGVSTSACNKNSDLIHIGKYTANSAQIRLKSLKTIDFKTDYSLCQKYDRNVNNSISSSAVSVSGTGNPYTEFVSANNSSALVFAHKSALTPPSDLATSGKLTLKEIKSYEYGEAAVFPGYLFEYVSYSGYGDYDTEKADYWGYYKSDFNTSLPGKYTTPTSSAKVDIWSLKKITTPLGGEIEVTYGSDQYAREGQGAVSKIPIPFLIKDATQTNQAYQCNIGKIFDNFTMHTSDFYSLGSVSSSTVDLVVPVESWCSTDGQINGQPVYWRDHYVQKNLKSALNWSSFSSSTGSISTYTSVISGTSTVYYTNLGTTPSTRPTLVSGKDNCACQSGVTMAASYHYTYGSGYFNVYLDVIQGGGTCVTNIRIKEPQTTETYTCEFSYADGFCKVQPLPFNYKPNPVTQSDHDLYLKQQMFDVFGMGPMVSYGKVTVKTRSNITTQSNGYTVYRFSNMNERPGLAPVNATIPAYAGWDLYGTDNRDFEEYGRIKRIEVYANLGDDNTDTNDGLISYTNNYYTFGNKIIEGARWYRTCFLASTETYKDGLLTKTIIHAWDKATAQPTELTIVDPTQGAITKQIQLAYTQTAYAGMGAKNVNSSNENNLRAVSQVKVIKRPINKDAYGDLIYSKSDNGKLIGGSKTVFSNQPYYRTLSSNHFIHSNSQTKPFWKATETYELAVDNNTAGNTADGSLTWRKVSDASVFNENTQGLLETKGLNGRYSSAIKMGYKEQFKVAGIGDASLNSFAFTGFEDGTLYGNSTSYYGGEISGASMQSKSPAVYMLYAGLSVLPYVITAHTGDYMAKLAPNSYGPGFSTINFDKDRTYRASIWVSTITNPTGQLVATLDGTINGSAQTLTSSVSFSNSNNVTVGNWRLLQLDIAVPANYTGANGPLGQNDLRFFIQNTGGVEMYADDFSIHPVDAPISGYVYNPATGWLMATLDNENFATKYTYDQAGRVIRVEKETKNGFKRVAESTYNFGRQ